MNTRSEHMTKTATTLGATRYVRREDSTRSHRSTFRAHLGLATTAVVAVVLASLGFGAHGARADVREDGAFSTSVPIEVPPFHGIQPSIALTYDSTRPNGLLGVGWRLGATSYIARAGRHGGAPRFDGTDAFLLDGEKLVACAPNCATGGTHETRRRDFSRISFDPTHGKWTRWRPDGVRLVYEPLALASSRGTYRWALESVTDTHGNTVRYSHSCEATECYLESIAYADGPERCFTKESPNPGLNLNYCLVEVGARVRFHYEARPDSVGYGTGGELAVTSKRLKSIVVRMNHELVRAYALTYAVSSSTGSSLLRSVQSFPSDATVDASGKVTAGATKPLPPTVFSTASMSAGSPGPWQTKTDATDGLTSIGAIGPGNPDYASVYPNIEIPNPAGVTSYLDSEHGGEPLKSTIVAGDFDKDGRTDVAAFGIAASPCKGVQVRTVLAKSAAEPPVSSSAPTGLNFASTSGYCEIAAFAADVDGNGADDVVVMNGKTWLTVAKASGDGTFSFDGQWTATGFHTYPVEMPECSVADADADGRSDLVCMYKPSSDTRWIGVGRSLPGGGFEITDTQVPTAGASDLGLVRMATGDVNADRKADVMLAVPIGQCGADCRHWSLLVAYADDLLVGYAADSGRPSPWVPTPTPWTPAGIARLMSGDVDGDGRADAVATTETGWSEGGAWSGWQREGGPGAAVKQIAVASNTDGRLEVFGIGMDDRLWRIWQTSPGGPWSNWQQEGGATPQLRQIAVAPNRDGRLEVLAVGTDYALWRMRQTSPGGPWGAWQQEGGPGASVKQIAVGRNADGRLEVFGIGMDDRLWHMWQTSPGGSWWGGWHQVGGAERRLHRIAVASNADGRLEVFGVSTNYALWHMPQISPSSELWGDWRLEGPPFLSVKEIAVARNADGRLEVFGIGFDDALRSIRQTSPGGWWSAWPQDGQPDVAVKQIVAAANADGRLEVFGIGMNDDEWQMRKSLGLPMEDGLWRIRQNSPGGALFGWQRLGGSGAGKQIAAGANADGRLEAFAIGMDDALHHIWQTSPLTAWTKLPDYAYVATATKGAPTPFVPKPRVRGCTRWIGDYNGDGRDDLPFAVATADGHFSGVGADCSGDSGPLSVGDTNGDGRADLLFFGYPESDAYEGAGADAPDPEPDLDDDGKPAGDPQPDPDPDPDPNAGSGVFTVSDSVSPVRPVDRFRWMPADVTGTGRQDLVYVHFRNPGYEVYTLRRKASGGFERTSTPISPQPNMPLANPNAAAWMPIDVGGGPGGIADGKTDLVLVEGAPPLLRVNTLLSTGTGWTPKVDTPAYYGSADVQTWRPANVNRDGRSDLVHFLPLASGVRLEYLLSSGDGTWLYDKRDYFTTATADAPALTAPNMHEFRSIDFDGDQLTDFAFVEPFVDGSVSGTLIRTLAGNGDGSWSARSEKESKVLTAADMRLVEPMEFNGDGMQDLALVRPDKGCLRVTAFVSTGTSWTLDDSHTPVRPDCQASAGVEDSKNIRLLDGDQDGDTDVLYLSRRSTGTDSYATAAHMLLNLPGDGWSVVDEPSLPLRYPDTWAYGAIDSDSDGRGELFHVDGSDLATLRWATRSDLLKEVANGRGATTSISYRSLVGGRSYLPSGSLPIVVDTVKTSDAAHSPPVEESTRWGYDGGRWSDADNRLLGFASVRSTQANTVAVTRYELTDACGARPTAATLESRQGTLFTSRESTFLDPGAAAPFTCLTTELAERECDHKSECQAKLTSLDHDGYGNVTTKMERRTKPGPPDQPPRPVSTGMRKTTTDFRPNTTAYIVDRPARRQTYEFDPAAPAGTEWRRKAATEYLYDANTAWDSPPGAKGELRWTRAWLDRGDRFVETRFDYDEQGNLTKTTYPKTTGPTGVVETIEYDSERALFPVKRCDPVGCTEQTWKVKFGVPETVTDLNGQVTTYAYDAYGRLTKVTNPDQSTSSTSYLDEGSWQGPDSERQRIRTEISDGSPGDGVLWQEQLLDGLGRVYKTIREGDGSGEIITETRFADASSRPAATSDAYLAGDERETWTEDGPRPTWTEYRYDDAHRLTATVLADGATYETDYLLGATRTRDPIGRQKTAVRDEFGRTIRVEELDRHPCPGCPAKTSTTTYAYDALDRRIRITDAAGNITETVWDSLGRKVSERDPDRGTRSWTWRDDGTPDSATDAKGQVTRWFYDSTAGRPQRKEERTSDGELARTTTWTWDLDPATGDPSTGTHGHSLGRIVRLAYSTPVASGATESWYDRLGRVSRTRQCVDNSCAELGFDFDHAGRLATLTYPDAQGALSNVSERVGHGYDGAGRLKTVIGQDPTAIPTSTPYATDLSYTPLGQLTNLKHSNGVIDRLTYDDTRHWLDAIEVAGPDTLYRGNYQHYRDGKIDTVAEIQPGATAKGLPAELEQAYQYDDLGRLTNVSASDPARSRAYGYDAIGRMTSSTTAGSYSYDDPAHVHAPTSTAGGHSRAYDANGNLSELLDPDGRELRIEWTVSDMPERITGNTRGARTVMGYDAADQRVVKHDDVGTTYYFGRYLEQDPQGRIVKYYWAGDRLVARRDGDGNLTHFHQDRLGSTRLLTDSNGDVVGRYGYDPFGKPINAPTQDVRMWHGERFDHDSGLIYMNARFYDPELGRFASPDSIIPDPYRPQSLDRYAYVENDPANYTDPSGHMKMQVEQRKEAAAESFWGAMYNRALAAGCEPWSTCVPITSSTIITEIAGKPETRGFWNEGACVGGSTCRSEWARNSSSTVELYGSPFPTGDGLLDRQSQTGDAGSTPPAGADAGGPPSAGAGPTQAATDGGVPSPAQPDAKSEPIELDIGDDYDLTGWVEGATRVGEVYLTDVNSMVRNVLATAGSRQIKRLNIRVHGSSSGVKIGSDSVDINTFAVYRSQLAQLQGRFAPGGFVHLQACNVGQSQAFLRQLAVTLGVPVYAGTGRQNNVLRFNTGNYVVCNSSGSCGSSKRP
jgi:RHS repeat-associated protein